MAKLLLVSIPMMFILLPLAGASPRWISGVGSGLPHCWQQPAFQSRTLALGLRGGAKKSSKQAEESESEDLDDDFGDDDFGDASAADFEGEDTLGRRLVSAVNRTPPITQGFLTLSIAITLGAMLFNGNQYPRCLLLDWSEVLHGQVWRLLTAFMYFGPFDISFALTIQFVWQYMSQLEKVHHKEPEQFVIMWVTGAAFLLAAFACTALPTAHLGHNLSCFLVYVWARTYEGHEINFMELFTMRSELMPWFLALQVQRPL
jgi:Derlin-2/3